jgi:hypothetical protein
MNNYRLIPGLYSVLLATAGFDRFSVDAWRARILKGS